MRILLWREKERRTQKEKVICYVVIANAWLAIGKE